MSGWDIYNLGVSGYGTDQEYLLLKRLIDQIRPDLVLLIFCQNDHDDNATNRRYGYYKPYFTLDQNQLALHGVPVPKAALLSIGPWLFKNWIVARLAEIVSAKRTFWPVVRFPTPRVLRSRYERMSKNMGRSWRSVLSGTDRKKKPFAKPRISPALKPIRSMSI